MQHIEKKTKSKSHIVAEVIILAVILAIIAAFALPKLMELINSSRQKSANNDAQIIAVVAQTWLTKQETAEKLPDVDEKNYLSAENVKEIADMESTIEQEVKKTITISVKGSKAPDCYKLAEVKLVKDTFTGTVKK